MRIVIEIPETKYLSLKKCLENGITLGMTDIAVLNGTPLPEGAEILTAEAYSDLCLRASQERKTGKWIPSYGNVKCSVCGTVRDCREVGKATHFCPHCGAKMEGAEE